MMRQAMLTLALAGSLTPVASAVEFESPNQPVLIQGEQNVLSSNLTIPLVIDLIAGVIDNFGFIATATAGSDLFTRMEAESLYRWPDPTNVGDTRQFMYPLPNGSAIALQGNVDFQLSFTIDILGRTFAFQIVAFAIPFQASVENFEPFLLPSQPTPQMRVDTDPQAGIIRRRLTVLPLTFGIFALNTGIDFEAIPRCFSNVRGVGLDHLSGGDRYRVTDPTFPISESLYENTGRVEFTSEYVVDTVTDIGYFIGAGIFVEFDISVLGVNVNIIDLTFDIFSQYFSLFTNAARATFVSEPYAHPIPTLELPIRQVDFGEIEIGDVQAFTLPIANSGELDMFTAVQWEGDDTFTVSPNEFTVQPSGQGSTVVTFTPAGVGEFEGVVRIATSDPLQPYLEVPVVGTGIRPVNDDTLNIDDTGDFADGGSGTVFTGCGCASQGSGFSVLPLAAASLFLVRRRRS